MGRFERRRRNLRRNYRLPEEGPLVSISLQKLLLLFLGFAWLVSLAIYLNLQANDDHEIFIFSHLLVSSARYKKSLKEYVPVSDDSGKATSRNSVVMVEKRTVGERDPILDILKQAGIEEFDKDSLAMLPTWDQIERLYGKKPVVRGLESCKSFRSSVPVGKAAIGPAGMFNSGTNSLVSYLKDNCKLEGDRVLWQVPWGKHMLASRKWTHTVHGDESINKSHVLPVVIVRDPFTWMGSMCRNPYSARWSHSKDHCPNLVPRIDDLELFPSLQSDSVPISIAFPESTPSTWESMAHLWNDWYAQYFYEGDYPRIMVRYEDLLFHPKQMIEAVCKCAGGISERNFKYQLETSKIGPGHNKSASNLVAAIIKYGMSDHRISGMTPEDITFAQETLDPELMFAFKYNIPLLP